MNELHEFSTIRDFQQQYPKVARTEDALRWLIRNRYQNGLRDAKAVVKRQGRWYVHASRFAEWMLNGADA